MSSTTSSDRLALLSYAIFTIILIALEGSISANQVCLTPREKWSCGLFDRPLVVGCSTGHKPRPLHVKEWDLSQKK